MENHKTESKAVKFLLIGISVLFLFVMLVLPLFGVVTEALKKGWQVYVEAVTDSYTIDALMLTLKATVIAVLCNTFFGLCAAWAVPGIILATVFVTFPFVFRELLPVLESIGTDEEEAAALMGAKGWTIFSKITFPHIKGASVRHRLVYGKGNGRIWCCISIIRTSQRTYKYIATACGDFI